MTDPPRKPDDDRPRWRELDEPSPPDDPFAPGAPGGRAGDDAPRWREIDDPTPPERVPGWRALDERESWRVDDGLGPAGDGEPPGEIGHGSRSTDHGHGSRSTDHGHGSRSTDHGLDGGPIDHDQDREGRPVDHAHDHDHDQDPARRPTIPPATGSQPPVQLKRWNPYKNLTDDNRQFVRDLMRFPSVTAGIIGVLGVLYAWMLAAGWELTLIAPSRWGYSLALAFGALEPDLLRAGEWWRLFTPALLHASVLHVTINGFMLYQLGRLAENVFGRAGLVVLFVGSAISGSLASAFFGEQMSVGASGAVMGLVGANIAFGLRHRARIPEFLRGLFGPTLWFYAAVILLVGMVPMVDGWGHAGGFAGGALLGLVLPSPILREGKVPGWVYAPAALALGFALAAMAITLPRAVTFDGGVARDEIEAFDAALAAGRWEEASAALDRADRVEPGSPLLSALRHQLSEVAMVEEAWTTSVAQLDVLAAQDPEYVEGNALLLNNYAWALFIAYPTDAARLERGVALARAALTIREDDPVVLNTLAWGLYLSGDDHGALATIEQAMRENDGKHLDSDIYIYVAALHAVGRDDEALETYRAAVAEYPDGVLHAEVAALLAAAYHGEGAAGRTPWVDEEAGDPATDTPTDPGSPDTATDHGSRDTATDHGSSDTATDPGSRDPVADPDREDAPDPASAADSGGWSPARATWD